MAKGKVETIDTIDDSLEIPVVKVEREEVETPKRKEKVENTKKEKELINCLRNEKVIVRYIPKQTGMVSNPKHVLYGGMSETAKRTFVVPMLTSGMYVNVLTDNEKAFLEEIMGLEPNALSVYKKVDNFWDDSNDSGISKVTLRKQDNYLDLSSPEDYIKYKILLANKNVIAPSLKALQDHPKTTYQFVIIEEGEETRSAKDSMSTVMKCYKEYGKVEDDTFTLRTIIEIIDGRPTSPSSKLEFLQTKINTLIQAKPKLFLNVITDPILPIKVTIRKGIDTGVISAKGNYLYLRSDNTPLCEAGEEPTMSMAAKYLSSPKHQDMLFAIQAKVN